MNRVCTACAQIASADCLLLNKTDGLDPGHLAAQHAKGAVLAVPQLVALVSWGGHSRLLMAPRTAPLRAHGRLQCGRATVRL